MQAREICGSTGKVRAGGGIVGIVQVSSGCGSACPGEVGVPCVLLGALCRTESGPETCSN